MCYVIIQEMWVILGGLSGVNRSAILRECRNCKGRRVNLVSSMLLPWWHVPVSYTHLDVYKRQIYVS